ncbi:MAG: putative molybdenum carrier protein [Deltaproteobacteria bacterium]|nr:putative molybdenum carrier protein [Deltaproteobacteria bacterium]
MGADVERIVSGGQAGVDRAALDAGREAGLPTGGWCPKGRRAEDGPIPEGYPLRETPSTAYSQRTRWNVRDSDATLVLHRGRMGRGTRLTLRAAAETGRPCLAVDLSAADPEAVRRWLREHAVRALNVAGPRESEFGGIYAEALAFLRGLFA